MELNKKVIIRADKAGVFTEQLSVRMEMKLNSRIAEEFGIGTELHHFQN